jgi:hypothetical protein
MKKATIILIILPLAATLIMYGKIFAQSDIGSGGESVEELKETEISTVDSTPAPAPDKSLQEEEMDEEIAGEDA